MEYAFNRRRPGGTRELHATISHLRSASPLRMKRHARNRPTLRGGGDFRRRQPRASSASADFGLGYSRIVPPGQCGRAFFPIRISSVLWRRQRLGIELADAAVRADDEGQRECVPVAVRIGADKGNAAAHRQPCRATPLQPVAPISRQSGVGEADPRGMKRARGAVSSCVYC